MKNNKWFWIGMTLLVVVLTAAVIGINTWYSSGSVRVVGGDIRVNLSGTGYIFNAETGELEGQTPVRVTGETLATDAEVFSGVLEVLGYVNVTEGTITTTKAVLRDDSGFWQIECLETCLHYEDTADGGKTPVEHICDYYYTYYLYPQREDFLVVAVKDFDEEYPDYVVLGGSEDEARETYQWFMENKPEN